MDGKALFIFKCLWARLSHPWSRLKWGQGTYTYSSQPEVQSTDPTPVVFHFFTVEKWCAVNCLSPYLEVLQLYLSCFYIGKAMQISSCLLLAFLILLLYTASTSPNVCKHIIPLCVNTLLLSSAVYKTWVCTVEFVGSGKWTQHVCVAQDTIMLQTLALLEQYWRTTSPW